MKQATSLAIDKEYSHEAGTENRHAGQETLGSDDLLFSRRCVLLFCCNESSSHRVVEGIQCRVKLQRRLESGD